VRVARPALVAALGLVVGLALLAVLLTRGGAEAPRLVPRSAPADVQEKTTTSGRMVARSRAAGMTWSSSIRASSASVVAGRRMRAECTVTWGGTLR